MKHNNLILALVGLCGSGKSLASEYFTKQNYQKVYFGELTLEELKRRKLAINETNENTIRQALRKEYGMAAYALKSFQKIDTLLKKGPVLIDGLYSLSEYTVLKKRYPILYVIAIFTPKSLRYQRLTQRTIRPLTEQEAEQRDMNEILHIEKAPPITLADITLINDSTIEHFQQQLQHLNNSLKPK